MPWRITRVYPRVGGGNASVGISAYRRRGLSPRGRGKLAPIVGKIAAIGSIPAWAGETPAVRNPGIPLQVYPRVGGGNPRGKAGRRHNRGLSPRGRGKRRVVRPVILPQGSIPAWAGETCRHTAGSPTGWVYPRVGGGNGARTYLQQASDGLSPRGRGKHWGTANPPRYSRSIPAWAGETFPTPGRPGKSRGLSPRGRGKPPSLLRRGRRPGSIPAWAGETPEIPRYGQVQGVYPRVGGGNPMPIAVSIAACGLSPRGRGKPGDIVEETGKVRSIPAWAGETGTPTMAP